MKKNYLFFMLLIISLITFSCVSDDETIQPNNIDLQRISKLDMGKIHNKILDISIDVCNKYLEKRNLGGGVQTFRYPTHEERLEVLGEVNNEIVYNLSEELDLSIDTTNELLTEMGYDKENFINGTIEQPNYGSANQKLVPYYQSIIYELDNMEDLELFTNNLEALYSGATNLNNEEKLILRKTIDISISSATYWTTSQSAAYALNENLFNGKGGVSIMKLRPVSSQHKAIIKADVNGAIDGGIAGAIGGTAMGAGVGALPGALLELAWELH